MTISELMLVVCLRTQVHPLMKSYSESCDLRSSGLYQSKKKCDQEGQELHGRPYHQFVQPMPEIRGHECLDRTVK